MTIDLELRDRIKQGLNAGGSNIKMAADHGVSRGTVQNVRQDIEEEERLRRHFGGLLPWEREEIAKLQAEYDERYAKGLEPNACYDGKPMQCQCGEWSYWPSCYACGKEKSGQWPTKK